MDVKEAREIIHPETTEKALSKIEYYAGFRGHEAKVQAAYIATIIAAAAMKKQEAVLPEEREDGYRYCRSCGKEVGESANYCKHCGQLLVSGDESPFDVEILRTLEEVLLSMDQNMEGE